MRLGSSLPTTTQPSLTPPYHSTSTVYTLQLSTRRAQPTPASSRDTVSISSRNRLRTHMVLVNGTTFACQSCIKGHRSKKCSHHSRPLLEIGRKGRPTSQCESCRALRATKSVHGRCDCVGKDQGKKAKISLPDGLVFPPQPEVASGPRLSALLNPCDCRRGGRCNCCTSEARARASTFASPGPAGLSGLSTDAAGSSTSPACKASCCGPPVASTSRASSASVSVSAGCCPAPPRSGSSPYPLPKHSNYKPSTARPSHAPIVIPRLPNFLFVPSTHYTSSCFCGDSCTCIGCPTHDPQGRKSPNLDHSNESCGCGTVECQGIAVGNDVHDNTSPHLGTESIGWFSALPSSSALPSFEELLQRVSDKGGYGDGVDLQRTRSGGAVKGWNDGGGNELVEPRGCAAMYEEEAYDGGCGDLCTCASNCGCRTGIDATARNDALSRLAEAAATISRSHG